MSPVQLGTQNEVLIRPAKSLSGVITVPGDKSISHRAALLLALADGTGTIENFSPAADCRSTLACLKKLGVEIKETKENITIAGRGFGGLRRPEAALDCGNSGTSLRLLAGILSFCDFSARLDGDASLRTRPMQRVVEPLSRMGARFDAPTGTAPLTVHGGALSGIEYRLPVASAQVKSAVLLAGLHAKGETTVIETAPTRDHTERMLEFLGVTLTAVPERDESTAEVDFRKKPKTTGQRITVKPIEKIAPKTLFIPGDVSSAAYFIAAALLVRRSEVIIQDVGLNPTRTAFLRLLKQMGANLAIEKTGERNGEPFGTVTVKSSTLSPRKISGEAVAGLIDELPLLALLATQSEGTTVIRDAQELKVKESDRIATVAENLRRMGAKVGILDDGWVIEGKSELDGAEIDPQGDHRIAMTFAVAGLVAHGQALISEAGSVAVSYPNFFETLEALRR